ncbi:hypothetical protein FB645_000860 [Coemansia sp. IMI 203386]|nr:hypothetical protein FB645_000860 [Coemansia sp. IMI 203386]
MISFEVLGEIMLLESFLDQAIRHALNILGMHAQMCNLQNQGHSGDPQQAKETDRLKYALKAMRSKAATTFRIVDRLYARTGGNEPSEGLRIRSRVYRFLNVCFSEILRLDEAQAGAEVADDDGDGDGDNIEEMGALSRRLYVRPHQTPATVVQMFLDMSMQVAQLQNDACQTSAPPVVGSAWYDLLSYLLVQLALFAHRDGKHSIQSVLDAMDIVSPRSNSRQQLYPQLWFPDSCLDATSFDSDWPAIRDLMESLESPHSEAAYSNLDTLASLCPPDGFLERLGGFLELSLDKLEQPTLDLYSGIRQTGNFPKGFFETPDDMEDMPSHPQLFSDIDHVFIDRFTPHRANRTSAFIDDESSRSPSERIAQFQAYSAMVMSSTKDTYPANADSDLDSISSPGSPTADVRSQRIRMDTLGRQPNLVVEDPNDLSMDAAMDVENTAVAESPTAFLSARHDKRLLDPVRNMQMPPPALDFNLQSATIADSDEPEQLPPSKSAMTTPKSEKPRNVSDWIHGDIEGGGRPHRRRHETAYTPNTSLTRTSIISQPPPQTILSPRNIAAAQRKSKRLEALAMTPENNRLISSNIQQELAQPQITPEHQIGMSAGAKTRSSSRYVVRKEQGDTEGGGRKHRKRQRENTIDVLPL